MKSERILLGFGILVSMLYLSAAIQAVPMSTAFTYQGRLHDAGSPANKAYDFQFKLYDDPNVVTGQQIGSTVTTEGIDVVNSYFTAKLDFGSNVFDGNACWLEIGVRPGELNDPNEYTTLSPRQEVTAAPYAIYAQIASGVKDGVGWDEISNRPAGLDDGDDVGIKSETDPQIGNNTTNYIPKWNGSALISGTVYDDGNVGIGTTNPNEKLHIAGSVKIVDGSQGTGKVLTSDAAGKASWQNTIVGLKAYDSGWFDVTVATTYTKSHNLGTTKVLLNIYVVQNGDGSGWCFCGQGSLNYGAGWRYTSLVELTTTTISVRTGEDYLGMIVDKNGEYITQEQNGHARIIMLALE